MPKHRKVRAQKPQSSPEARAGAASLAFVADSAALDPELASLFTLTPGPVQEPAKAQCHARQTLTKASESEISDSSSSANSAPEESGDKDGAPAEESESAGGRKEKPRDEDEVGPNESSSAETPGIERKARSLKKRKRRTKDDEDSLEETYMRRLARQEEREDAKRDAERSKKRRRIPDGSALEVVESKEETDSEDEADGSDEAASDVEDDSGAGSDFSIPQHESLAPSKDPPDLEKSARTVFLGNVSTEAIKSKSGKRTLLKYLSSFFSSLPEHSPPHKVESIRFRSTAFASAIPKKAAFAKKELMDATTKSTNAYAVYSTQMAAREAANRLNGTVVLDRHLRVDQIAHPAKIDHRRCVFVGNLGFVDDESQIREDEETEGKKRKKEPSDVEEGLWREFSKAGTVESVRVVRDPQTRVGKGIAYVQFTDENSVEAALLFNDKKFPPMLPRKLRVVRAKAQRRPPKRNQAKPAQTGVYNRKISQEEKSFIGRAGKLLGKAAATHVRSGKGSHDYVARKRNATFKPPESFVFEGHRASSKQGTSGLKLGRSEKKKGGKPNNRSTKRAAAWKAAKKSK